MDKESKIKRIIEYLNENKSDDTINNIYELKGYSGLIKLSLLIALVFMLIMVMVDGEDIREHFQSCKTCN